jgi:carbamoyltransferase
MDLVYEEHGAAFPSEWFHDAAAVLVEDGRVIAGVEEERLNRIKHTNKAPVSAIQFCLDHCGAGINDLDQLVVAANENFLTKSIGKLDLHRIAAAPLPQPRALIHDLLQRGLGQDIADAKLTFMPHHLAHAVSAYALSGFDASLVYTADGGGDDIAGLVVNAAGPRVNVLQKTPIAKSLGILYLDVIGYLGFGLFEEYKVMGLAPYGDPAKYRALFKSFYHLMPGGEYVLNYDLPDALAHLGRARKRQEPLTQAHIDVAAALQEALEEIVFHVLRHYQAKTGQTRLCLAGGVAHNCTLNGKLLYSGLFEDIFVQPAAHDGGLALGAALSPFLNGGSAGSGKQPTRLAHVYLGPTVGGPAEIEAALLGWSDFIDYERADGVAARTAQLLADGAVVGWVQDRSEFGPRALGNRSIVADPRPAENKDIINRMVKKREAFRPFAPAVLEEYAAEFFDLPRRCARSPFMTFVVRVREEKRALLGATTHVDGTARIQTVARHENEKFWQMIDAFRELTGVPVLLNTSFNNNVEPIVDSARDALVCFLTTQLNYLVIGDYLISKRAAGPEAYLRLSPALPLYTRLRQTRKFVAPGVPKVVCELTNTYNELYNVEAGADTFAVLADADGRQTIAALLARHGVAEERRGAVLAELLDLWARRAISLEPSS